MKLLIIMIKLFFNPSRTFNALKTVSLSSTKLVRASDLKFNDEGRRQRISYKDYSFRILIDSIFHSYIYIYKRSSNEDRLGSWQEGLLYRANDEEKIILSAGIDSIFRMI